MAIAWTTKQADDRFSKFIRERDPVCKRCGRRPSTDCSHYFERHHSATRFDQANADGLCRPCHQLWEGRRNGADEWKREQLGSKRYEALERRHNSIMNREEAIAKFQHDHQKN